ncbi:hypothetical protein [Indioceanicola profundi]|uniref:hypothetical protein n=1 Tax=Indioceanicola profundi TaxID=2220096 RepID=UPI000E6AB5A6|nr:hypothetical protein [Indioceanicola profundi]
MRKAAHWLLLCALMVQAWVPAGFMPDIGRLAEGGFPLVLCTRIIQSGSAQESAVAADHDHGPDMHAGHHDAGHAPAEMAPVGPCPFATMAGAALPVLLYALLLLVVWPRSPVPKPPRTDVRRPLARSADCLARGPPGPAVSVA